MDRFFDANNPLMRFLSQMVDLVILNVLTLACCVPVVTAGASLTAMNYVMLHQLRGEETYIRRMFLKSFRENLKQGAALGLLYLAVGLLGYLDLRILRSFDAKLTTGMMIALTVVLMLIFVLGVWTFALQARFENTIRGTLANAVRLFLGHLPRTLAMAAVWLAWLAALWHFQGILALPVLLYGLSLPGFICTILYDPVFRKMEEEQVQDESDIRESQRI